MYSKTQEVICTFSHTEVWCSVSGVQKTGALVFHEWCPKDYWITALKGCCVLHRYVATIFSYADLLCIKATIHLSEKETSPPKTMCGCACGGVTKNCYNSLTLCNTVVSVQLRIPGAPPSLPPSPTTTTTTTTPVFSWGTLQQLCETLVTVVAV